MRVTVSVALLCTATVVVLASLPTRSALWLSLASVSALVLSWAALRMMWTEVLQSRRDNAADRAAAASAYRSLFSVRAAEHAEFTTAMTERLAEAHISQRELEGLLVQHRTRTQRAETRLAAESRALDEARAAVRRLEETVAGLQPAVVDLVAWEEQAVQRAEAKPAARLKQA